ncbi:MAG: DUF2589 domain-containing protein [Bacteroidales bacterium]|nr:DUF2589 domain-containing protein [Bacteroidales bacterium]
MAVDTTPSKVAVGQLQDLPFDNLIGGPLMAAVDAQSKAAKAAVDFIRSVGFNVKEDGTKEAINVVFTYVKGTEKVNLIVPLLTIVPIPYLRIDDVSITFKAKINASSAEKTVDKSHIDTKVTAGGSYGVGFFGPRINFNASVSAKKDSTAVRDSKYSVEYTMDISVHAVQDDMPKGMATVLQILHESIDSTPAGGSITFIQGPPTDVKVLTEDREFTLKAKLLNGEKLPIAGKKLKISFKDAVVKAQLKVGDTFTEIVNTGVELPTSDSNNQGELPLVMKILKDTGTENYEKDIVFQLTSEIQTLSSQEFSIKVKKA